MVVIANSMPDDLDAARAADIDEYLSKPLAMRALLAVVARMLANCRRLANSSQ